MNEIDPDTEPNVEDLFDFVENYNLFTEGSRILLGRSPVDGSWTISVVHPDHFISTSNETVLIEGSHSTLGKAIEKAIGSRQEEALKVIKDRESWLRGELADIERLKSQLGVS